MTSPDKLRVGRSLMSSGKTVSGVGVKLRRESRRRETEVGSSVQLHGRISLIPKTVICIKHFPTEFIVAEDCVKHLDE